MSINNEFNIGGTWSELNLGGAPPTVNQINIGCYVNDSSANNTWYRKIDGTITSVAIGGGGGTVPIAAPFTQGIVYGETDDGGNYNTGLGYGISFGAAGTTANFAVAVGEGAQATGSNSTAVGYSAQATGGNSTAVGSGVSVNGTGSIVVGSGSTVSGANSIAVGSDNYVTNQDTFVFGNNIGSASNPLASNTLYLDSNINGIVAPGLLASGTAANVGLIESNGVLTLGTISGGSSTPAAPTTQGVVYGETDKSGNYNTGLGYGINFGTTGINAVAVGDGASALEKDSIAVGYSAYASGTDSIAVGYGAYATGTDSIAVGAAAYANGTGSIAVGYSANVTGQVSVAVGYSATASGQDSIAVGAAAIASGQDSTAVGQGAQAVGSYSIALGAYAGVSQTASNTLYIGSLLPTQGITSIIIPQLQQQTPTPGDYYVLYNPNVGMYLSTTHP